MSIGRHPDISGNLTLTVPGMGSGGRTFDDVKEYADYGGRFSPLGEPPRPGGDGSDEGDLWSLVTLESPGIDVDIAFYYNSHSRSNGPFGYRRTCSLNLYARGSGTPIASGPYAGHLPIITLTRGDDSTTTYIYDEENGVFVCQSPDLLNKLYLFLDGPLAPIWAEYTPDGRWVGYPANTDGRISRILIAQDAVENWHHFYYSSKGLLETVEDKVGRLVTLTYNSQDLLETVQDWANRVTTFQYDTNTQCSKPRLTGVTDAAGKNTNYEYDSNGRITRVQDAGGYVTTYAYDASGKVTGRTLIELNGDKANSTYDYAALKVADQSYAQIKVTDALTADFIHTSDEQFRLVRWQSPLNHVLTYIYNERGQESERIDQHGGIWTTTYDENGLPHYLYDAKNRETEIRHDDYANPIYIKRPDLGPQELIWGYPGSTYDPTGEKRRLQVSVNEVGNRTTYAYNSLGLITETTDAANHISTIGYDTFGNAISMLDWRLNETLYDHDLAGNMTWIQDADDEITFRTYDSGNRQLTVLNPLNQLSTNLYDPLGILSASIDFRGNRTTFLHNIFGANVHSEDPTGRTTAASYDKVGQQIESIDGLGKINTTTYDVVRRPVSSINPVMRAVTTIYDLTSDQIDGPPYDYPAHATLDEWAYRSTTIYDQIGRVIGEIDPLGHSTQTQYDSPIGSSFTYTATIDELSHRATTIYDMAGRAVGTVDYLGARTTTIYDALNRVTESIDPLNRRTTTLYDLVNAGVLSNATIDAKGQRSTVSYDSLYRPVLQSDVAGNISRTTYDALSRVESVTDPASKRTTYLYDMGTAANPASALLDANNNRSTSIYDAAGRIVMSVDAMGAVSTSVYDSAGRVVESINPLLHISTTVYDDAGRVLRTVDPEGNIVTNIYDQRYTVGAYVNLPSQGIVDERGYIVTQIYDAAGRAVATLNPDGTLFQTKYDVVNRPYLYIEPSTQATTVTYDVKQDDYNAVRSMDAIGQISTAIYDLSRQQIGTIDVTGNRTTSLYEPLGRVSAVSDARGNWTEHNYDDTGHKTTIIDANGGRTTNVYDTRGLVNKIYDPLNRPVDYEYNATADLVQRTDRRGVITNYVPDALGRTRLVQYSTKQATYVYDAAGRQTNMIDWTGDTSYDYDANDWTTGVNHSNDQDLVYAPDPSGNRVSLRDPQGGLVTYSYDSMNRLSTIRNPFGEVTTHTYDANGRLYTRAFANGAVETRTYDQIGRKHTLKLEKAGSTLSLYTTTYDKVTDPDTGKLRWQQQVQEYDGSITTYLYDVDHQLVDANRSGTNPYRTTYAYDPLGNRLRQDITIDDVHSYTTYAYDIANQLLSSTQDGAITTYSYDFNGNLVGMRNNIGRTTYTWDEENRLQDLVYPDSAPLVVRPNRFNKQIFGGRTQNLFSGTVTPVYTADGLRQAHTTNQGTTEYVWDGQNLLQELDSDGNVQNQYTNYPGQWGGLVSDRSGSDSTYYGFDDSDNTRALVDSSGAVSTSVTYLPFGEQIGPNGFNTDTFVSASGRFGYQNDSDRLRYVRARYLDVITGRWITRDPLGFDGGDINLYRTVGNDPVNRNDPSGERDVEDPKYWTPAEKREHELRDRQLRAAANISQHEPGILYEYVGDVAQVFKGYATTAGGMALGAVKGASLVQAYEAYEFFRQYGVNKNSLIVYTFKPLVDFANKSDRAFIQGDPEAFGEVFGFALLTAAPVGMKGANMVTAAGGVRSVAGKAVAGAKVASGEIASAAKSTARRAIGRSAASDWLRAREGEVVTYQSGSTSTSHVLTKHGGKLPHYLLTRIWKENARDQARTTFFSHDAAAHVIDNALNDPVNQAQINQWINNPSGGTSCNITYNSPRKLIGYGLQRVKIKGKLTWILTPRTYKNALIVLKRKTYQGNSYVILTAYPEK